MIFKKPQRRTGIFKSRIIQLHDQSVVLDEDIAQLQGMKTSSFNREMKRHQNLFPPDSRFRLTPEEFKSLKSQSGDSKAQGGRRYPPYVYTEGGLEIVLKVLKKKHSAQVGVAINKILDNLNEIQKSTSELARKLEELAKTNILPLKIVSDALPGLVQLPVQRLVGCSRLNSRSD
ncbi:MAG: ORF6N domain-containing protein [Acidobacteriia bacterium]|nr:ORF6N domain-containing protein [Terriglobia bacterium]